MTMRDLADRLFELRHERGLRLGEVASKLGTAKSTIGHYESGRTTPSISMLQEILDVYGVSMSEFFGQWKESA
jgi:HTH-type transcriptional repressor of puuD